MKHRISRRKFVRYSALGGGALFTGGMGVRLATQWNQERLQGFKQLSETEVEIVNAISDAMFPGDPKALYENPMPNGVEIGLANALDDYLDSIDRSTANLLRLLIHAIDDGGAVADLGVTRFRFRSRQERIDILDAWDRSFFATRRGAFRSLKILLSTAYCEHPDVLKAAGIHFTCGSIV